MSGDWFEKTRMPPASSQACMRVSMSSEEKSCRRSTFGSSHPSLSFIVCTSSPVSMSIVPAGRRSRGCMSGLRPSSNREELQFMLASPRQIGELGQPETLLEGLADTNPHRTPAEWIHLQVTKKRQEANSRGPHCKKTCCRSKWMLARGAWRQRKLQIRKPCLAPASGSPPPRTARQCPKRLQQAESRPHKAHVLGEALSKHDRQRENRDKNAAPATCHAKSRAKFMQTEFTEKYPKTRFAGNGGFRAAWTLWSDIFVCPPYRKKDRQPRVKITTIATTIAFGEAQSLKGAKSRP